MSDEMPTVEEIKARLKVEVPTEPEVIKVEEEPVKPQVDVANELRDLGRQVADTLRTAWNSQERQKLEVEIREGVKSFVDELDKMIREAKESPAAHKIKEEATQAKTRIESSDVGQKAKVSLVNGLHWLSEEIGKLADQFTITEKQASSNEEEKQ